MTMYLATLPDYSKDEEEDKKELTPEQEFDRLMKIGQKVTPENAHELFKDDPYAE